MHLTDQQLATVLAALRNLQIDLRDGTIDLTEDFLDITDGETPLSPEEIDALCESLNIHSTNEPEEETRRLAIVHMARDTHYDAGVCEVDEDARLSEGDDNGCYVSAWVWVDFSGTAFDKDTKADEEDPEDPHGLECTICTNESCAWCQAEKAATA